MEIRIVIRTSEQDATISGEDGFVIRILSCPYRVKPVNDSPPRIRPTNQSSYLHRRAIEDGGDAAIGRGRQEGYWEVNDRGISFEYS